MATLNLGRIKPVFRGAYNNATAYVVDDIVTSGGSSYICIAASTGNAVSNATYWTQMAAGGTDVANTITTQGDILYRDSSGLARLGAGTSGMFLKTQGTSANPVWATADSGKTLGVTKFTNSTRTSLPSQDTYNFFNTNYTQIKANSKIRVDVHLIGFSNDNGTVNFDLEYDGTTHSGEAMYSYTAQVYPHIITGIYLIDGASSTGAKNFKFQYDHAASSGKPFDIWNPNSSDDNRMQQTKSNIIFTEYDF